MSQHIFTRKELLWIAIFALQVFGGCSDSGAENSSCTPGELGCECTTANSCGADLLCSGAVCVATGTGGAASGGTAAGGASLGAAAIGGASIGGVSSGGASSGGAATGGASSGGAATGGAWAGGASGGGVSSGGASSGGAATGGAWAGGASSGGAGVGGQVAGGGGLSGTGSEAGSGGDGSGATAGAGIGGDGSGAEGGAVVDGLALTSAEFQDGAMIPDAHTCASGDFFGAPAPSLSWSGAPETTQSFALVLIDKTLVDAGDQLGYHSAFWNLPATVTSLPIAFGLSELLGADTINNGYLGPCPNFGGGGAEHTYLFTLYALPDAGITLGATLDAGFIQSLESAASAKAELSGTSTASNQ